MKRTESALIFQVFKIRVTDSDFRDQCVSKGKMSFCVSSKLLSSNALFTADGSFLLATPIRTPELPREPRTCWYKPCICDLCSKSQEIPSAPSSPRIPAHRVSSRSVIKPFLGARG